MQGLEYNRRVKRVGNAKERKHPERQIVESGLELQRKRIAHCLEGNPLWIDALLDRHGPEGNQAIVAGREVPREAHIVEVVTPKDRQVLDQKHRKGQPDPNQALRDGTVVRSVLGRHGLKLMNRLLCSSHPSS